MIPAVELPVRYAESDEGVHIAYAVVGDGDQDLVLVGGWMWSIAEQLGTPEGREFNEPVSASPG